jgi:hypothetical protein
LPNLSPQQSATYLRELNIYIVDKIVSNNNNPKVIDKRINLLDLDLGNFQSSVGPQTPKTPKKKKT